MNLFEQRESNVRYYATIFPNQFDKAEGVYLYDKDHQKFLDFFAGAGALNYGHNHQKISNSLIEYIQRGGLIHGLDLATTPKAGFLENFNEIILKPREFNYKVMFCGPTGTNAVEAALKLARKVKKRSTIFAFSGSFHGMTLGSLTVSSSLKARKGAGVPLNDVVFMPFPSGFNEHFDTLGYIRYVLEDDHSGIERPAAMIIETIQAEGGVHLLDTSWLIELRKLCHEFDILLICDDIQVGCGRTGTFFSFEPAKIKPDMVVLSKSISGCGLPMSILLLDPKIDQWQPGEHNGTFRGNQLAFVSANVALDFYKDETLMNHVKEMESIVHDYITNEILTIDERISYRGRGLLHGIDFKAMDHTGLCEDIQKRCYKNHLIVETCGRKGTVLKLLPPLIIQKEELMIGLEIIKDSILDLHQ